MTTLLTQQEDQCSGTTYTPALISWNPDEVDGTEYGALQCPILSLLFLEANRDA